MSVLTPFANLRLTTKILLLVGLLGSIALAISIYSMANMRSVDRGYRGLIERQAQSALLLSDAALLLSDSSKLVYAVLTEQEEHKMRAVNGVVSGLQKEFDATLARIRPLIPGRAAALDAIAAQAPAVFEHARAIVEAAARWRGDRALRIIHEGFEPALRALQADMEALRGASIAEFGHASVELNRTTNRTIVAAAIAVVGGLLLVLALSGYLSITQISRPIAALTRIMERLTDRRYDDAIPGTGRRDEVGTMAQALQVFKDSMQRADRLSIEVAKSEQARLLSEQIAREKTAFLALMSHEIRTPLNAMLGMTQLALKSELSPPQRMRIETILRAGRHLLSIINDILDLSKIDSGKLVLEKTDFELEHLLADVVGMLADKAADKGLPLHVRVADGAPRMLVGDPMRISQILLNYLDNAIKFTQRGEIALEIEVRPDGTEYWLLTGSVRDTGIGMDAQQVANLFQAFRQADASITRRFGGTGLGLAICRRLAESMDGSTGASSTPGAGSTFWFSARLGRSALSEPAPLSMVRPEENAGPDGPAPAAPSCAPGQDARALHGRRVLLVDDNALNRTVATGLLESGGLLVDAVDDGQAALDTLRAAPDGRYAAVLMDMQMPVMDGLTATRLLRTEPRFAGLPILAMTANATREDIAATVQAGMNAHIAKPIDEGALWDILLHWISREAVEAGSERNIPAPTAAETDDAPPMEIFTPAPLRELRQRLAPARFEALLAMFEEDCRARCLRIGEAAWAGHVDALRQEAHDLVSTAGSFGLLALLALGLELRRAAQAHDMRATRHVAARIERATGEGLRALRATFPPPRPADAER
ncbi:hybrid histidine protein kinase [Azotobacter vinelandii CA]|uniref:histidine kinase n=2 Tax=Azotobacter vinelandii TaxID=354 RepID=C1DM11_AZOVD|nr:ATP-binding protein [Azotobacter vinelandii]ACO79098.1 hybrid histidine protein kinase [Azotobacter vinelandii DJ]AGK14813.1 hybrid histidine protein kinase [Azotobacter vinelandii CA]AGK20966.1 hybrid histidine protein kinase [Azotobacter vinelandii CA6]SFX51012.1 Signal transduction histidine kinase [Azotobacter vinelandii]GLK59012.1 hypothetical protein GCM10017624_11690 [Azotobacter vinelandii]